MSKSRCEVSQLVHWYRDFLEHGRSAAFVSCVATRYDVATLVRLAKSSDFENRRAAVLALGMLGDQSSIATVGRAMRDQDRCVRLVAELAFEDLCRREFGDGPARILSTARRHIDGGRFDKAQTILNRLTDQLPSFAEAWYLQAVVRYEKHEFVQAVGVARRAASLNANHFGAQTIEAKSWLEIGSTTRALEAFRRSFAINPSQTQVEGYIDLLARQGRTGGTHRKP